MSGVGSSDEPGRQEQDRLDPGNGANGSFGVTGESRPLEVPRPYAVHMGLPSNPRPPSLAPTATNGVNTTIFSEGRVGKEITQSWPPIPTLNGPAPVHVSLFPQEEIPLQPPQQTHQSVHKELGNQLGGRDQMAACQHAVNKCLSWPPAQYMTHLEEVEQATVRSIKEAAFDSTETDKFSGKRRRMIVSGEEQDYTMASFGSIRERNRQAALAFRKRDVYYVNKLQATVDALERKNDVLMGAYKRLSTIAYAQSVVWRVGEVAIVAILDKSGGLVELIEKRDQFGLFPTHLTLGDQICSYLKCAKIMFTDRPRGADEQLLVPPQKFEVSRVSCTTYQNYRCRDTIIPLPPPIEGPHVRAYLCSVYVSD